MEARHAHQPTCRMRRVPTYSSTPTIRLTGIAWGPEAFEKAQAEDKPIFLSIGYSTCHWCHVMERESFENEESPRCSIVTSCL